MTIIMNTPDLEKAGGVATYCRVIKPHFTMDLEYFTVGSSAPCKKKIKSLIQLFYHYLSFCNKIRDFKLIHLNPSLMRRAVIRDGIFLIIAKAMCKKVIVFFHGWDEDCEKLIRRHFLHLFRIVYSRADIIVVLSSEFKRRLIEMGLCGTILIETTAVDNAMIDHAKIFMISRNIDLRKRFNVLFLARIEKAKGIYEAINAYQLLKKWYPFVTMTVVGDGTELDKVRRYARAESLKGIEFTGFRTGTVLGESYGQADVYLFPTTHGEGFPISVLEAMTYGLPILTRPVGGICDFFEDGRMGFLTETSDPAEMARLLERLVLNPDLRLKMGKYNHWYAKEHFSPSVIVRRLESIYSQVLVAASPAKKANNDTNL